MITPAVREHIRALVDEAPPLSAAQVARLRGLLAPTVTVTPVRTERVPLGVAA